MSTRKAAPSAVISESSAITWRPAHLLAGERGGFAPLQVLHHRGTRVSYTGNVARQAAGSFEAHHPEATIQGKMKAIPRIFVRLAAGAAAFFLIVFALAVLWLRYWGLPNIDRYRDDIVSSMSRASGMAVSAQRVRGGWEGVRPLLALDGFQMNDRRGKAALAFDRAEVTLSWGNPPLGRIRFHD